MISQNHLQLFIIKKFKDLPDTAIFTTKFIIEDHKKITFIIHDIEDSSWQFHSYYYFKDIEVARLITLEEIIQIDPSVLKIADMPEGFYATRNDQMSPWKIFTQESF